MKRKREKKYGRLYHISAILAVMIVISGVFAVILLVVSLYNNQMKTIQTLSHKVETMYDQETLDAKLAEAVNRAETETENQAKNALLEEMKGQFAEGRSTIGILRNYYPNDLVIASNGAYHFVPIQENLAKHNLTEDKLVLSEEGELTYQEGENVISHKGIDVSRYQGDINWKKVKADGVEYAFIRVGLRGYGTGEIVLDEKFEKNVKGAFSAGVKVGVYFFSQAITEQEAIEEAEFVIEQLEPYKDMITYPVAMDVEKVASENGRMNQLTKEERTNVTVAFLERISEEGYTPMVYGNLEMLGLMIDLEELEKYEKWFAYYDTSIYYPYDFKIWQYSDNGSVDGIKGDVDMNISFKTWGSE